MHALRRSAVAAISTLAVVATGLAVAPTADAVDTNSAVVISEVYGGGGNNGAKYTNDFIELYNKSTSPVSVAGWSVQYASATGTSYTATPLTGTVPAGGYYLIQEAKGTGGTDALPTPSAIGTIAMSASGGKVALVNSATALGCGAACASAAGVVDFVGFGNANDFAGTGATPAPSNTTSAFRTPLPSTNTGNNNTDFAVGAPTPAGSGTTPPPPTDCTVTPLPEACVPGPDTIQDVQGDGFISPKKGLAVSKVAGIVTAVRAVGSSRGFWIQEADPDAARTTASSGLFVFTSSVVPTVGDAVLVSGNVQDYYPLSSGETVPTTASLSMTELSQTTVTTVSTGNQVPATLTLTPTTVPARYAPVVASGNVEDITTVDPTNSAIEFWEAHEGMLVSVSDARVVGPGKAQYGEIYVTTKPTELATPRGGAYIKSYAETPAGRLLVSPVNGTVPAANVGDVLAGVTRGPVDWSTFGGYDIAATTVGTYVDNNLQGTTATAQATDQLAVATYNVENLAPGDPASKYERLGAGVVTNLKSPDVISVEEIQDNSGAADDGVVAADQTLGNLITAISAAGGPTYTAASIDPVNDADGGQPGGNIRSVFLYNAARVTFVAKATGDAVTPVTVAAGANGTAELSANPGRVAPTDEAWNSSRKPLAGEFLFDGKKVIIVANHLNSKGGDQSADGRFQPPNRSSEVQRNKQATLLNTFVKQVLAVDPGANVVLAGDFNDYQFSQPITTLTDNGATLTDLINTLPENERYTYNYNGVSQVLDHIFVSKPVTDVQYDVVHVNSEFSAQSSDHDPQVARIRLSSRKGSLTLDPTTVVVGGTTQVRLAGWDADKALTITLDSTVAGTVTTDASGAATFTLTVPAATTPGAHSVSATTADGVTASAALTAKAKPITLGTVKLAPSKQNAGKSVQVKLDSWAAQVPVSISIDGGATLKSVTTDAAGKATTSLLIPRTTSVGSHHVVVTASDGGSVSANLTVQSACVPAPGPNATRQQIVAWLLAVIFGNAC